MIKAVRKGGNVMKELIYVFLSVILMSVLFILIIRKEEVSLQYYTEKVAPDPALIDFIKHDFNVTQTGINNTLTQLFYKGILSLEHVHPSEEDTHIKYVFDQKSDLLTTTELYFIDWMIHECGDGVEVKLKDLESCLKNNENYIRIISQYKTVLLNMARHHGLYDDGPTEKGLQQSRTYKNHQHNITYLPKFFKTAKNTKKEELNVLLEIFDQSLSS